jgi:phosphoribosylformylglycinamidine cyclo-ligase
MGISYKEAGVDIEKGDLFVNRIKKMIGSTYNKQVVSGVGGFAALYERPGDFLLAASTDGVGTKLKLAIDLDKHDTIGIDLVAMCVNDLICTGARPLFFLDYLATSFLDLTVSEKIIEGIVAGCHMAQTALIGGETAEMPGLYAPKHYDLAGFSVGEVHKAKVLTGRNVTEGDTIIGLYSSGFHSNGYSLVRKLIDENEDELKYDCLTPTRIYVQPILKLLETFPENIKGIANITGGGIHNIPRINADFGYHLTNLPERQTLPNCMQIICERSKLDRHELYQTFNMGIGMAIVTDRPDEIMQFLIEQDEKVFVLGKITSNRAGAYF